MGATHPHRNRCRRLTAREWITVKEAALLTKRHTSRLYRWISEGRLVTGETSEGTTIVKVAEVLELETIMTRRRNNKTRREKG